MPLEQMPDVRLALPPAAGRRATGGVVLAMPPPAALQPLVEMARRSLAAPMAMLVVSGAGRATPTSAGVPDGMGARLKAACEAAAGGGKGEMPFQAASPLLANGAVLGTLCVFDVTARPAPSAAQQADLDALAAIAAQLLTVQARAVDAARQAAIATRMAQHTEAQLCAGLRLVSAALQGRARQATELAGRDALFGAADCVAGLEAAFEQVRNPAGFGGDARAFLLALIGNLQEAVGERDGWPVGLLTPEPTLLVAQERMPAIGLAALALLMRALRRARAPVALCLRDEDGLLLSTEQQGGAPGDQRDRALLSLLAGLAVPGGVSVQEDGTQRITVRLAG